MTHPALGPIVQRTSINRFDASYAIDDATVRGLVRHAARPVFDVLDIV